MSVFTCLACHVLFAECETQRAHYKSDWHRYNLKRKVADLPPVSAENFKQRVLNAQNTQPADKEKLSLLCELCRKLFSSHNALQNHVLSKKHKEMELKGTETTKMGETGNGRNQDKISQILDENQGATGVHKKCVMEKDDNEMEMAETDSDVESVDSFGDEEGLSVEECLFCSMVSQSLEENTQHMTVKHSFFLPDAEYISNLEGLLTYLGQKVGLGNLCLWCNDKGKRFHSVQAVQKHMIDKGHCKMLHEGDALLEYADFYDYRSSYPDHSPEQGDSTEDMEMDVVAPDILAVDGYELVLPSGATIGHRSLQRYYKQNFNPRSTDRTRSMLPRMLAQYKALGWCGAKGPVAERRCKDLASVQRMKSKFYMHLGVKANKLQPHLRAQVMF